MINMNVEVPITKSLKINFLTCHFSNYLQSEINFILANLNIKVTFCFTQLSPQTSHYTINSVTIFLLRVVNLSPAYLTLIISYKLLVEHA